MCGGERELVYVGLSFYVRKFCHDMRNVYLCMPKTSRVLKVSVNCVASLIHESSKFTHVNWTNEYK